jgi:transposase
MFQECLPLVKFHTIALSDLDRAVLQRTISTGKAPARVTKRARVLLKADTADEGPGWRDAAIAEAVEVSIPTIERLRKRAATEGVQVAIGDRPRPPRGGKLDGAQEARLTALACSDPPAGQKRWTLALLVTGFAALEGGAEVSDETVRQILKKTNCRLT